MKEQQPLLTFNLILESLYIRLALDFEELSLTGALSDGGSPTVELWAPETERMSRLTSNYGGSEQPIYQMISSKGDQVIRQIPSALT
jgi:hypothetical protein